MSAQYSIVQPDESAILQRPSPSHASADLIFRPRRKPYNLEELRYIWSLAPLDVLPPTLSLTRTNRSPPIMHFGWIIGDESKARLMDKAYETKCYAYVYDDVFQEEDGAEGPLLLNELDTMEGAAEDTVVGLGIKLPVLQFVDVVSTSANRFTPFLTLFTNHQLDKDLPTEEDIKRIQEELNFEGKPAWWPSFYFSWIDKL
ncbi:hypothetical protein EIP86_005188 [Pleurotus ostreatoroseus]|nr:hypothetical protein EIP86_005188 [Pleurotus ostreatoroseus]